MLKYEPNVYGQNLTKDDSLHHSCDHFVILSGCQARNIYDCVLRLRQNTEYQKALKEPEI